MFSGLVSCAAASVALQPSRCDQPDDLNIILSTFVYTAVLRVQLLCLAAISLRDQPDGCNDAGPLSALNQHRIVEMSCFDMKASSI